MLKSSSDARLARQSQLSMRKRALEERSKCGHVRTIANRPHVGEWTRRVNLAKPASEAGASQEFHTSTHSCSGHADDSFHKTEAPYWRLASRRPVVGRGSSVGSSALVQVSVGSPTVRSVVAQMRSEVGERKRRKKLPLSATKRTLKVNEHMSTN